MHHVTDVQRRARLAVRHALVPDARVDSPEAATRAMTVLHATEPATVYLSCWARTESVSIADVDRALYRDRSLVKQLAMRRTLFVFPRDLLPEAVSSASARVASTVHVRMSKDVVAVGLADDGCDWFDRARAEILALLEGAPEGRTALELRQAVPMIDVKVVPPTGEAWGAPQILVQLGAAGDIMRAENTGHWRTSRPRWTLTRHWLGADLPQVHAGDGYREMVRRWLHTFGPGTEADLVWWLGSTKSTVRKALAEIGAVAVSLDGGSTGWLLPDDLDEIPDPGPWVALLPVLDPTVMGWRGRDFYLGPHSEPLFDRRGNAGTTVWVDGRIVGCWVHDQDGAVRVHLLERVSRSSRQALDDEAERLTGWLAGDRVATGYMSQAMKDATSI
ncbi:winged helix DNA-binding protein [Rhodococcus sp. OK519]|uniref:winged helix DNA-binding domain-containing protein n=1 Tax=Rhodococcus sp. OK519 TaxID=2135729 RepID=UPI000D36DB3A|nr:winged helix DNA-binding protein [Rhodococcus sp. OK519]